MKIRALNMIIKESLLKNPVNGNGIFLLFLSLSLAVGFLACDTANDVKPLREQVYIKLYGGQGTDQGNDLELLPDGGFILAGSTTSYGENSDVYLIRADNMGNEVWTRSYDFGSDEYGASVIVDEEGNFVVCGSVVDSVFDGKPYRNVLVLKTDPSGNLLTQKTYGNPGDTLRDEFANQIINVPGFGGYFITATHIKNENESWFYLLRVDKALNEIYLGVPESNRRKYVGVTGAINLAAASVLVSAPNELFYTFGTTSGSGGNGGGTLPKGLNFYLTVWDARVQSDYNPSFFGTDADDIGITFTMGTGTKNFLIGGYSGTASGTEKKALLMKLLNSGSDVSPLFATEWSWTDTIYATGNQVKTEIESAIQTVDGAIVALLTIENLSAQVNDDFGLVKIGIGKGGKRQVLWNHAYGSNDVDKGSKVIELGDGSLAIVSSIGFPVNTPLSVSKVGLLKLNAEGELIPDQ